MIKFKELEWSVAAYASRECRECIVHSACIELCAISIEYRVVEDSDTLIAYLISPGSSNILLVDFIPSGVQEAKSLCQQHFESQLKPWIYEYEVR